MRVKDLMESEVVSAVRAESLRAAGEALARIGAGVLPVVDEDRRVIGIVTDRDMFLALTSRDTRPSKLTVGEMMVSPVETCRPEEDLMSALRRMEEHGLRRLPVVDHVGRLTGILTLDDLVVEARAAGGVEHLGTLFPNVVRALQAAVRRRRERYAPIRDAG